MNYKMPIYETRVDVCVAKDVIKPYGGRVRICPESERRKAVQRFLRGLKSKEKTEVEHE